MSSERRSLVRPLALAMAIAGLLGAWAWIGDEPEPPAAALPKRARRAKPTPAVSQVNASPAAPTNSPTDQEPARAVDSLASASSPSSSTPAAPAASPSAASVAATAPGPEQSAAPRNESPAMATEGTQATASASQALDDPPKPGSIQSPLRAMQPPSGAVVPVPLEAVSPKVVRYAQRLVQQYDEDQDGQLSEAEWQPFGESFRVSDLDRDGVIAVDEVARRIAAYARRRTLHSMPLAAPTPAEIAAAGPTTTTGNAASASGSSASGASRPARRYFVPAGRLPGGLPEWFNERDTDGDGQLTLAEFAPDARPELALEFEAFDANRDGVITSQEGAREQSRRAAAEAEAAAQAAAAQAAANPGAPVATAPRP